MDAHRRMFVRMGASVTLSAAALAGTSTAASAQPVRPGHDEPAAGRQVANVPCDPEALNTAIETANTRGAATILLAPGCTYSYTDPAGPSSALPQITGRITIAGRPGSRITRAPSASARFRIIEVAAGARLTATNLSIDNGDVDGQGGGIRNDGDIVLAGTNISENAATGDGGGLANASPGATALVYGNSTISGNSGASGGGVANYGNMRIMGSHVTANTTPAGGGGGVYTHENADTTLSSSRVDQNFAGFAGGGVLNYGVTRLYGTVVENNANSAAEGFPGGGIYNVTENIAVPAVVVSQASSIRANEPDDCYPAGTIPGCAP